MTEITHLVVLLKPQAAGVSSLNSAKQKVAECLQEARHRVEILGIEDGDPLLVVLGDLAVLKKSQEILNEHGRLLHLEHVSLVERLRIH